MLYTENTKDQLQGVIAVYNNSIAFMPYENNILQPERMPLKKDLSKLTQLISSNEDFKEFSFDSIIPNMVLHFSNNECHIIWTSDAKRVELIFNDALPMDSGIYPIPKLVWKLYHNTLQVFALKDTVVTSDTPLFQAPFLNVNNLGEVCMGTANTINHYTNYNDIINFIENQFFSSYFTHTNSNNLIHGNITSMYLEQQTLNSKAFKSALLIKSSLTISNLL